jgi:phosphonate transport system permease protein
MTTNPNPNQPPNDAPTPDDDDDDRIPLLPSKVPPGIAAALSIVPGLGQIVTGHLMRGFLIGFFIMSIFGLSLWRIDEEEIRLSIFGVTILSQEVEEETSASNITPQLETELNEPDANVRNGTAATDTDTEAQPDGPAPTATSAFSTFGEPGSSGTGREPTPTPNPLTEIREPGTLDEERGVGLEEDTEVTETLDTTAIGLLPEEAPTAADEPTSADDIGELQLGIFPFVSLNDLARPQETAAFYALLASFFALIAYVWNMYDAYACSVRGKGSPPSLGMLFMLLGTLTIGAHITEINVAKAVNEISDIGPRLSVILWPWDPDEILERDTEALDASTPLVVPSPEIARCSSEDPDCLILQQNLLIDDRAEELCEDVALPEQEIPEDEPWVRVDPNCGLRAAPRPISGPLGEGTDITVTGGNYRPNEEAVLFIVQPFGEPFRPRSDENAQIITVETDANGAFELEFMIPNNIIFPDDRTQPIVAEVLVRQTREVGEPYLVDEFWLSLEGIVVTLFLALMATAGALVLAVPMSFLAARNLMSTNPVTLGIYYVVRVIMNVVRSIEPIIWALIAIIWVGPGPFAGVIALTIHTIAALGKLYSESIESIDDGPIEAIQATGANRLQTIIYAVVPQIIPPFVSFSIYRWDINVRMSTIIGAVGGGGIGVVLIQWIRLGDNHSVGIAVWMIAIVVTILDYTSSRIREAYV